jgi:hypothetical protein
MPQTAFTWNITTAERYHDMLGAVPPAEQYRSAFLLGEASDHRGEDGAARFTIYRVSDGVYYEGSRPVTRAEFRQLTATL